MNTEYLRIENGIKTEGRVELLHSIYLQLFQGKTAGMVSGNFFEVDSLIDILTGEDAFSYGRIYYKGELVSLYGSLDCLRGKLTVLNQDRQLVDNLSIAENIFMVQAKPKECAFSNDALNRKAQVVLEQFEIEVDVFKPVITLSNVERSQIELIKAYVCGIEMVIIDQRIDAFMEEEITRIFQLVEKLKAQGVSFVLVDNLLPQVLRYADTLTLFNRGKTIRVLNRQEFEEEKIYSFFTYRYFDKPVSGWSAEEDEVRDEIFRMEGIRSASLRDVSFCLRRGEIVSILCEERKGLEEFVEIMKGELTPCGGKMLLGGRRYEPRDMCRAVRQGVCFIENNPIKNNLFYNMDTFTNLYLVKGTKVRSVWWRKRFQKSIRAYIEKVFNEDISRVPIGMLSTQRLQKLVYHKWLLYKPKVAVCINPFSTVDIYMGIIAREMIWEYAKKGISVVIIQNRWSLQDAESTVYILDDGVLRRE